MDIITRLERFRKSIDEEIRNIPSVEELPLFYEPIHYINQLSGKKIRPILAILSGLSVGGHIENLLPPAAAVELLHNFSLVHDDIMDEDDIRRGKETVHVKWDVGTAILTGDGLIGLAYRKLLMTPNIDDLRIARLFTDAMLEICEGQALDKTFEKIPIVSRDEYLNMIGKKTATLIQLTCQLGAIVGLGTKEQINVLADFGYQLCMAFEIQDDLLDIFADENELGKRVGSDLAMNKKTIVTTFLSEKVGKVPIEIKSVEKVKALLKSQGIIEEIQQMIESYFSQAKKLLLCMPQNEYTSLLVDLTEFIQTREK
jgi:geranylgeranyl pyrophosphate synthase